MTPRDSSPHPTLPQPHLAPPPVWVVRLLQLAGRHAPLYVGDVLLQVEQGPSVIVHLVRGVPRHGEHLVVVLAGPGVGHGDLEGHLGGPAVGVQQGGGHLDLVLHQQTVETNTDLANQSVVEEPAGQLYDGYIALVKE